jgi:hypothetical protein
VTKGAPHVVLHLCHDVERIEQAVDFKVMNLYTISFMYLNYLKHTLAAALRCTILPSQKAAAAAGILVNVVLDCFCC